LAGLSSLGVRPGAYPRGEHLKGPGLDHKDRLDRLARDKHFGIFYILDTDKKQNKPVFVLD